MGNVGGVGKGGRNTETEKVQQKGPDRRQLSMSADANEVAQKALSTLREVQNRASDARLPNVTSGPVSKNTVKVVSPILNQKSGG